MLDAGDWGLMGNMDYGNCDLGVKSQLLNLLAVWPQASYLLVWGLSFPCCKSLSYPWILKDYLGKDWKVSGPGQGQSIPKNCHLGRLG